MIRPNIIEDFRKEVSRRKEDGGCMNNLSGYHSSIFQDFESFLRTETDLVEDDVNLVLDKYN